MHNWKHLIHTLLITNTHDMGYSSEKLLNNSKQSMYSNKKIKETCTEKLEIHKMAEIPPAHTVTGKTSDKIYISKTCIM